MKRPATSPCQSNSKKHRSIKGKERAHDFCVEEPLQLAREEIHSDVEDSDNIPVRLLQHVDIYDNDTGDLIPLAQLLELQYNTKSTNYIATGYARPWLDDAEDDTTDDNDSDSDLNSNSGSGSLPPSSPVKTSRILEFTYYYYDKVRRTMDRNIYIRTRIAWYVLGTPSEGYTPNYTPFWKQVSLLHLMVAEALREPRTTYQNILDQLPELSRQLDSHTVPVRELLGRDFEETDLEDDDTLAFVASAIQSVCDACGIRRSPLVKRFTSDKPIYTTSTSDSTRPTPKKNGSNTFKPQQTNSTVITPIVGQIAEQLFNNCFRVIGDMQEAEKVADEIAIVKEHNDNPTTVIWGGAAAENPNYYTSVMIDGVEYVVGEIVMVIPGEDDNAARAQNDKTDAAQSPNQYGNQLWFCQIFYFYEEKGKKLFHGQWLVHGSKTILQETAHSRSLYLINSCATNPVASIFKKCQVRFLSEDEKEPFDDRDPRSENYHCGFCWDEEHAAFVNLPTNEEYMVSFAGLPSHKPCFSCGMEASTQSNELRQYTNGFSVYNINYHINDFVYVRPKTDTQLLDIAQIMAMSRSDDENFKVHIRYLGRYDDYVYKKQQTEKNAENLLFDERRLFLTTRTREVNPEDLNGRCYIQHLQTEEDIQKWICQDDNFYLNQQGDDRKYSGLLSIKRDELLQCRECLDNRKNEMKRAQNLFRRNGPLRGLELFAGAGGLGTGMDLSKYVNTKWAVEYSPAAAKTYARNHPQTKVYCQDSSLLLKHAIETHQGKNPRPLLSNDQTTFCPNMPEKDQVDFIFGGPPCQSFSGANLNKQADDIRSTMPCNMLSFLEHYSADFLLLENVRGLLNHPLQSEQIGRILSGGIKSGVVKFIMRTLIALGYQVHWKLLQAGQYGTPQNRERVIFWAAKRGLPLPKHPVPVYAWKKGSVKATLPIGTKLPPPTRSVIPGDCHQFAPLKPITVDDALSDLPKFDWVNPHIFIKATNADEKYDELRSLHLCIPQIDAVYNGSESSEFEMYPGYPHGIEYALRPQNRYQIWLRQGMELSMDMGGGSKKVMGHYTKRFSSRVIEATTTVPLEEGADHHNLPEILQPKIRTSTKTNLSFYGRLSPDGHFTCTMTRLSPGTRNARPLHPNQRRMVTIRECARAQGFPDHYIFESTSSGSGIYDDQIRQIGNAVPVPLALALGKELGVALTAMWEEKQRRGSPIL